MEEEDSSDETGKMKGKSILLVIKGPKEHQSPGDGSPCPISPAVRMSQKRAGVADSFTLILEVEEHPGFGACHFVKWLQLSPPAPIVLLLRFALRPSFTQRGNRWLVTEATSHIHFIYANSMRSLGKKKKKKNFAN